ncbi:thymidine phosphorylase family protein [Thiohalophilus sp.]|uniref:thymidine phosphorylase family protein n=1 Tax=Thiohalophilus sp. TaxID=3028392 RepID=UPI0039766F2D
MQPLSPSPDDNGDKARLKLRRVAIDTYHENVAFLHRNCELYRAEGFQALSKIVIMANGRRIYAVLNVVDDEAIVGTEELGLAEQAFTQLDMQPGEPARVLHAEPVESMDAVRRKIRGERLLHQDYRDIASDIAASRYSKMEMAAFLVACTQSGLDREETLYLTRAMAETGEYLHWNAPLVTDKHCIGGLPGNRTTMLIVPIVAAHGLLMPKTSSRAITSPAGTADTMSVLAGVDLSPHTIYQVVDKTRACLVWGGRAHLAPADDILISVERPLGIDSEAQMVASILSKKLAAGATHLLIDIPVGPTAKVRHMSQALRLRKLFEYIGDRIGIHLEVVISDGSQPIGCGIGPMLEARDVMQVLEGNPNAPSDLRQKSLRLAGRILEFDPDVRGGQGYGIARDILEDGRALRKMQEIIAAQGKIEYAFIAGPLNIEITAEQEGVVTVIDNFQLAKIASLAGAPMERAAGVDLLKKLGDPVTPGEPLYRIHAAFSADFNFARHLAEQNSGYRIGHPDEISQTYMEI